jgi:hypothetical protein
MKWLTDILTEVDNHTYDYIRVLALLGALAGLGLQVWVVVRMAPPPQSFDFQNFGIGLGAMFAGVGVAMKLKPDSTGESNGNP